MSEWKEISLDSFIRKGSVELGRGDIISRDDIANDPGPYPIYSSSAQGDGRFGQYGKHMFDEELITWSVDGGGRLFYRPRHRYSVTNVCGYLRLRDDAFDYRFVHYLLDFQHRYISFDYQTKAHPSVIRHLYHLVPLPLPEQRKIARILTTVDHLIEQTEALIEKYKSIKQGMMHDLFTRGVDSTGQLRPPYEDAPDLYKQSPLGWIPKEWEASILNDAIRIIDCKHYTPSFVSDGYAFVRPRNVKIEGLDLSDIDYVSKDDFRLLTDKHEPRRGDIIFSRNASFGVPCFVDTNQPLAIGQDTVVMTRSTATTKFVYYTLLSPPVEKQVLQASTGSTFGRINLAFIRQLQIPLPPDLEQKEIAARFDAINQTIKREQVRNNKLAKTKTGLMQDLLTGKVRVNVDEAEEVTADV
jgi:type I restriction enzyme, S subunit